MESAKGAWHVGLEPWVVCKRNFEGFDTFAGNDAFEYEFSESMELSEARFSRFWIQGPPFPRWEEAVEDIEVFGALNVALGFVVKSRCGEKAVG